VAPVVVTSSTSSTCAPASVIPPYTSNEPRTFSSRRLLDRRAWGGV
jgi:hypothetical protein